MLVIKDSEGGIFGAYVNEPFRPCGRYYGTGECFLWKSAYSNSDAFRFKAFPYSGINDYMVFSDPTFISLGGGDGKYGLWFDDNLVKGVSSTCPTFGNEPLSDEGDKFEIIGLELWRVGPAPQN